MEKEGIGFFIIILGILFSSLSSFLCKSLCHGKCIGDITSSCLFLFLFSSIALIVSGASLIITTKSKVDGNGVTIQIKR